MKGALRLKVLEWIEDAGSNFTDFLEGFLVAGYGASYKTMEYERRRARQRREKEHENSIKIRSREDARAYAQQRYDDLLYHLKKDGLIVEDEKAASGYSLTSRGYIRLKMLRIDRMESLPPTAVYTAEISERVVIITFDIPERERRKRNWLRSVLKNLGLKFVQKSVWVGKCSLPANFIDDLKAMGISECVEIFEVTKQGSLRHIL